MKTQSRMLGGTLVEVLIALLIVAVGLFALISFQAELLRERGLISQKEVALNLAQDKIHALRNYTILSHPPAGPFAYDDIIDGTSSTTTSGALFTTTWTVTDLTNPVRKSVNVVVSWTDPVNVGQTITLSTIINKIDPALSGKVAEGL